MTTKKIPTETKRGNGAERFSNERELYEALRRWAWERRRIRPVDGVDVGVKAQARHVRHLRSLAVPFKPRSVEREVRQAADMLENLVRARQKNRLPADSLVLAALRGLRPESTALPLPTRQFQPTKAGPAPKASRRGRHGWEPLRHLLDSLGCRNGKPRRGTTTDDLVASVVLVGLVKPGDFRGVMKRARTDAALSVAAIRGSNAPPTVTLTDGLEVIRARVRIALSRR